MPMLSHVHQLFSAEQCQAYIHALRWKDRPLHCPRCHSHEVDPWGNYHYRPGCKRYWCNGCKRTFNDLTNTLLHQSKRPLSYWILATFLLCLACSSRRIARSETRRQKSTWDAGHVVAARSANRVGAITIKTGPRLSPGSVARGLWSYRRREILP
jgi:transposase-like protein